VFFCDMMPFNLADGTSCLTPFQGYEDVTPCSLVCKYQRFETNFVFLESFMGEIS
jgi:hypothetical protein